MKGLSLLYILMFILCPLLAEDNTQNAIKEINQIKRNGENFFYAEATSQTWEEAIDNAKTLLSAQIEMWAKSEKSDEKDVYVARASEHLFSIKAARGQLFRAFVYVKKNDLLALSANDDFLVVPINNADTPRVSLVTPSSNLSQLREERIETDLKEQRKANEAVDNQSDSYVPAPEKTQFSIPDEQVYQLTPIEQEMLEVGSFSDVSFFIRNLQSSNKIRKIGKYVEMPNDIDCYLFVYNPQGEIPAYLHKTAQGYFNLQSKTVDDINNYKGCGALWFSLR